MADAYALQRKRKLLVTIEPWSWSLDWKLTPDQLRDRTLAGDYDADMEAIAAMLAEVEEPCYCAWGQEMEDTSDGSPGPDGCRGTTSRPTGTRWISSANASPTCN